MMAAFRVLWRALVHLYDESLLMIRANVVWFIGSIPLFFVVLIGTWLFVPATDPDAGPLVWPLLLTAFVMLVVPSPMAVGVYALAAVIVSGETPEFTLFWASVRRWWRRALVMFAIGIVVLGGLIFNTTFYISVTQGWLQAISVLWLYAIVYWITLQAYLLPLLLTAEDGGPLDPATVSTRQIAPLTSLYKRSAILALANPIFSFVLMFTTVLVMLLSAIALPVYPLIGMAYVGLVGARALRQLREKYYPPDSEEATG